MSGSHLKAPGSAGGYLLNFIENAFEQDSLEEEADLIADVRTRLGTCNAVVAQRWKEIKKEVASQYSIIECPTCQQDALSADVGSVKCLFCNYTADPETAANDYVANVLGHHNRWATKHDGGEWPISTCPECGHDALVTQVPGPNDTHTSYCFNCGQDYEAGQLEQCYDCGELYDCGDEPGIHICSGCFQAKVAKD